MIGVRDTRTWSVKRWIPTGGRKPHDMLLEPDGDRLWVMNFESFRSPKRDSSLVQLRLSTGKIEREIIFSDSHSEENTQLSHFARASDGWWAVVGFLGAQGIKPASANENAPGTIWMVSPEGEARRLDTRVPGLEKLTGEVLSVIMDAEKKTFCASAPYTNAVFEVDYAKSLLLRTYSVPEPGAIHYEGGKRGLLIASGKDSRSIYDFTAASPDGKILSMPGGNGSHFFRLPLA